MGIRSSTMKVLLISSLLLAVATADSCSDCTAVVTTIAGRLMSDESLESQKAILVGGLCPGAEDVAQCEANLPDLCRTSGHLHDLRRLQDGHPGGNRPAIRARRPRRNRG